jgi:hypothetical protein
MLRTVCSASSPTPLATRIRFPVGIGNLQLLAQHPHLLQGAENLLRHALRQVDKAMVIMDINMTDVAPLEAGLIGNGTNNVPGLHPVGMPHFDSKCLKRDAIRSTFLTRRLAPLETIASLVRRSSFNLIAPLAPGRPRLTRFKLGRSPART